MTASISSASSASSGPTYRPLRAAAKALLFLSSLASSSGFLAPRVAASRVVAQKAARASLHRTPRMSTLANPHTIPATQELRLPEQPAINCYPKFPRAAVNVVVVRHRPLNLGREYLFVQRSKEPGTNQWSLPGGSVEVGEPMLAAGAREVLEETTLDQNVLQFYPRCFMTTDAIYPDEVGNVKYHFVISQMVCWASSDAVARAGDDAKAVKWMTLQQLRKLHPSQVFRGVPEVIETLERLVDVGCITKADLVRVNAHAAASGSHVVLEDGGPSACSSGSPHLIPRM